MGDFTKIEKEFNSIVTPKIQQAAKNPTFTIAPAQMQNEINNILRRESTLFRFQKMKDVCEITKRNLICYVSPWLQRPTGEPALSINDNDMNGFMNAISGLDCKKGLDLLLHTPGGGVTATESIVKYLREKFHNDIRVIVPHMAMSAGTMIACASKQIIMGKESSLGPIDPQYMGVPAQGVVLEFSRAMKETIQSPDKSLIWREIIQQYRPTFVGECENAIALAKDLATNWLTTCMFKNAKNKENKAHSVISELLDHSASKFHDRHYDYEACKKLGLNVIRLERDQNLQDKVLSLYHSYMISINHLPIAKYIESQNGQTFMVRSSAMA